MKLPLSSSMNLEIFPIHINKEIQRDEKIVDLILSSSKQKIQDGDIFVISQKIISKQEGRVVNLSDVIPSDLAVGIAAEYNKDPKLVEAAKKAKRSTSRALRNGATTSSAISSSLAPTPTPMRCGRSPRRRRRLCAIRSTILKRPLPSS